MVRDQKVFCILKTYRVANTVLVTYAKKYAIPPNIAYILKNIDEYTFFHNYLYNKCKLKHSFANFFLLLCFEIRSKQAFRRHTDTMTYTFIFKLV